MRRIGTGLALILSMLLGSVTLAAAPAYADADVFVGQVAMLRSWPTGLCLDSNEVGKVYTLKCNFGDYQKWRYTKYGTVYRVYRMTNVKTGRCLDSDFNGSLYTSPCQEPNSWQGWYVFSFSADNTVRRIANFKTGRWLDANKPGLLPYTNGTNRESNYWDWRPGF